MTVSLKWMRSEMRETRYVFNKMIHLRIPIINSRLIRITQFLDLEAYLGLMFIRLAEIRREILRFLYWLEYLHLSIDIQAINQYIKCYQIHLHKSKK